MRSTTGRGRRKTKYTWLPVIGTINYGTGGNVYPVQCQQGILDVTLTGGNSCGILPLTFDEPHDEDPAPALTASMVDIIGNEYFIKRIVGKVFVNIEADFEGSDQNVLNCPAILCTAGFFVAPVDPTTMGSPVAFTTEPAQYDPQAAVTTREPWIWRRSWMLGFEDIPNEAGFSTRVLNTATQPFAMCYPSANVRYPGVMDGPHVDAKTARRVRKHERLWFSFSAQTVPIGSDALPGTAYIYARFTEDVRILGALRKARGRGSFD